MRVCLVSRELAPLTGGGIGVYVSEMARALAGAGHEVHLLTEAHEGLAGAAASAPRGVRLHATELSAGVAALDAYPTYAMKYSMGVLESLKRLHAGTAFDYVELPDYHAEGYFTVQARRTVGGLEGAVLAARLHSPWGLCRRADGQWSLDRDGALIEHMELASVAGADAIIAPAARVLDEVLTECRASGFEPGSTSRTLGLPLDAARLRDEAGRLAPERSASGRPVVLYYGRIQHLKGVDVLVKAAVAMLESGVEADFRFIGGDTATGPFGRSMLDFLRSRVPTRWTSRITFEPPRPRSGLGAAIRGAAVCCFPSRWEAFSMACVEAMSLGAAVIAGDAGGLGEIVEDGVSGVLVRPGDAADLESALRRLLGDAGLRSAIAGAAPARAAEVCDPAAIVRGIEELVVEVRGQRRTPTPRAPGAASAVPEVTVLIPYYNLGSYLPATLESLRRQTFTGYETLIVDDGSTDAESVALLERLSGPGLRILRKANGGLSSARNAGFREARGRWVLPLDADDLLAPDFLAKTVAVMRADPGLAVVSTLVSMFETDPEKPGGGWVPLGLDRDILPVFNVGAAAGSLIDRGAALDAGGYDEQMTSYEDWEFWCRLAARGARAAVIPEFLFHYRVRPDSMFRTEAVARDLPLRAYILRRHAGLARRPERVMRLLLGTGLTPAEADVRARAMLAENLRYRIADRLNGALKTMRVHRALKALAGLPGWAAGPGARR